MRTTPSSRIRPRILSYSNFSAAWIPGGIHKTRRTMEAGLITCRRRISARSPRHLSRQTHRESKPRRMRLPLRPEKRKMSKGHFRVGYPWVLAALLAAAAPSLVLAQQPPAQQQPAQQPPTASEPAAPAPHGTQAVPWSSLSSDQQKLLGKFSDNWSTLPPERQQALARGSTRWLSMSTRERGQAQQRFQRWRSLPPDQRSALRDRWERFQSLPPNQQGAVRQNFRRFQQLPPERRQMLREQWRNASPAERQQMIQRAREQHLRQMPNRPQMRPPQMRNPQLRSPPSSGRPRR